MADSSDVEVALRERVQAVRDAAFPGVPVVRGWPADNDLSSVAASNGAIVAVTQRPGNFSRDTSRYFPRNFELATVAPTLTVSVSGAAATFAGTCSIDQIAGIRATSGEWAVRCGAGDTAGTIASALAALSGGTATGPTVTAAGLSYAATARDQPYLRPTRQQGVQFAVLVWTADPVRRDQIAGAIDAALSDVQFLSFDDGSSGHMTWAGSMPTDKGRDETLYRRDLYYLVDYSTTIARADPRVLFADAQIAVGNVTHAIVASLVNAGHVEIAQSLRSGGAAKIVMGNGVDDNYVVTHGLGTQNVVIQVRDPNDSYHEVPGVDTSAPTLNTVQIGLVSPLAMNAAILVLVLPIGG